MQYIIQKFDFEFTANLQHCRATIPSKKKRQICILMKLDKKSSQNYSFL